ncbi:uncharacterized protein [Pocillopora verrucosa]|uniref:uncharacterized protein isoform X2 n=1 Tax=Pocillopora verrucosa TaxID=203993 RepID=UPI003340AB9E
METSIFKKDFDWRGGTVAPPVNESKHYELDSIEDVDDLNYQSRTPQAGCIHGLSRKGKPSVDVKIFHCSLSVRGANWNESNEREMCSS